VKLQAVQCCLNYINLPIERDGERIPCTPDCASGYGVTFKFPRPAAEDLPDGESDGQSLELSDSDLR